MVFSALIAVVAVGWLYWLVLGHAPGTLKRLALRLTLLGVSAALVVSAQRRGLFLRSSVGFQIAILLTLLTVVVAYLYLVRFCRRCGRMVRNMKLKECPRCEAPLPRHGMAA